MSGIRWRLWKDVVAQREAEVAQQQCEMAAMRALLKQLEWAGWMRMSQPFDPPAHECCCLVCGRPRSMGHRHDCRLHAVLAKG